MKQNLEHLQIFGNGMSTFISNEKRTKSDVQKTCKGILISYTEISKHLRVWVSHTHQLLIRSKPVVNESRRGADLLIEHPLPPPKKPFRPQTGQPKPRGHSCKNALEKYLAAKPIEGGKISKKTCVKDITAKEYNKDKLA